MTTTLRRSQSRGGRSVSMFAVSAQWVTVRRRFALPFMVFAFVSSVFAFRAGDETVMLPGNRGWDHLAVSDDAVTAKHATADMARMPPGVTLLRDSRSQRVLAVRGKGVQDGTTESGTAKSATTSQAIDDVRLLSALNRVAPAFGITDAAQALKPHRQFTDSLGFTHIRLRQQHQGIRVVGADMAVRFDAEGRAYQVDGSYKPIPLTNTTPLVSVQKAVGMARKMINQSVSGLTVKREECVIFAMGKTPRLAWEIELVSPMRRWLFWVDAWSGDVLLGFDNCHEIAAPTTKGNHVSISGNILSGEGGQAVSLTGWRESNGVYYLFNKIQHWYIYNVASSGYPDNNTYAHRYTSNWGATDPAEMSAARNFDYTQQYFVQRHGRSSFDGAGAYARGNVHEGEQYVNAYWDGEDFHFGDGDGTYAHALTTLDVVAHEYTHAVTEHTADLFYYGESGALNESFSDIFAACAEFFAQPDGRSDYPNAQRGHADWLIGEDCWLVSKSLRDMRNPANTVTVGNGVQPTRYRGTHWYEGTEDNGGVHYNGGVQSFFFYLLCEGGAGNNDGIDYDVAGIGIANAERVAYRTLTVYCSPSTDYAAARVAWISAAQDLNPDWVSSVEAAWAAVGVGAGGGTSSGDQWDPDDDTGAGATVLTLSANEQQHGFHSLSSTDLYDWFKVYLVAGQKAVFRSDGSTGDNYGELFRDSAGQTRVFFDDDSGEGLQFSISYTPDISGWYYLRVRGYTVGASMQYTLKYQQAEASLPSVDLLTALDAGSLNWTTGGDSVWIGQSFETHDAVDAAQSGSIGNNQSSWLEATIQGPGELSFWWRVSSEAGYDFLRVSIDGMLVEERSGEGDWAQDVVHVPAGSHRIRWAYIKDGSVLGGRDQAWVDQVMWSPGSVMMPSGGQVVETRRPLFQWPVVTGAGWYRLWITRDGETVMTPWVDASTNWVSPNDLPGGDYRWWVQPWISGQGYGGWSDAASFRIETAVPAAIALIEPIGTLAVSDLTFRWGKDADATWYRLWVSDPSGGAWHNQWYGMSGTGDGSAMVSDHPGGTSRWWLRPWGPDGYGPWSGPLTFSTPDPTPAVPTLLAPSGTVSSPVIFQYQSERAEWYRIYVANGSGVVHDQWTQATSSVPVNLRAGDYRCWVAAWNRLSRRTVWSPYSDFKVE